MTIRTKKLNTEIVKDYKVTTFMVYDNHMNPMGPAKTEQGFNSDGQYIVYDAGGNMYIDDELVIIKNEV